MKITCAIEGVAVALALSSAVLTGPPRSALGGAGRAAICRSSLTWIDSEKIRAFYWNKWASKDFPAKAANAGFNTMMVQFCNGKRVGKADLQAWGKLANENALRYFVGIWWSYPSHVEKMFPKSKSGIGRRYRGYVPAKGHSKGKVHRCTVCPVDERYWRDWIMPAPVEMAKLAKEVGLTGIILDTEMYSTNEADGKMYGFYYFGGVCLCDHCFGGFLESVEAKETAKDVPPADRPDWLKKSGHSKAYEARLKTVVQALAREMEQAVHRIDSHLLLGFMNYYGEGDFFFNGVRDGFKTPQRPVIIWPETPTYKMGYFPHVDKTRAMFEKIGDIVYVPGLWLEAHPPNNLARQVHDLAMHSDGYWLFISKKDLVATDAILAFLKQGHDKVAKGQATSDEAPFVDLWDKYDPIATLPGSWRFKTDADDGSRAKKWFAADLDVSDWQTMKIGEFWDKQLGTRYIGVAWYRVDFDVPAEAKGRKLLLAFGAVDEEGWVWVNGEPVGEHAQGPGGWDKRFLIDVTKALKPGQRNLVAVRVFNSALAGGIWKPVRLIAEK